MREDVPDAVSKFISLIGDKHKTHIEVREVFAAGKSGAFVSLVDCSGGHDGVYVLKVDEIPAAKIDEECLFCHSIAGLYTR